MVDIWGRIVDFVLSFWAWLTWPVLLLSDWVFLRGLIIRAVLTGVKRGWRWLVKWFIEQVADAARAGVGEMLEESYQRGLEEKTSEWWDYVEKKESERWQRLEEMISERLAELNPEPPPHGITGTPCPKSGLYRLQGGGMQYIVERVFEKGEIFQPGPTDVVEMGGRPLGTNEDKVLWVYQSPKGSDD